MSRAMPRISIRAKLAIPISATILVLGLGTSAMVVRSSRNALTEELRHRSLALVSETSVRATQEILVDDVVGLDGVIDDLMTRPDVVYVLVAGQTGAVVAESFPAGTPTDLMEILAVHGNGASAPLAFRTEHGVVHDYEAPMISGRLGFVHVGVGQARILERARRQGRNMLLLTLGSTLAAAFIAYLVAHMATRPIRQLAMAANEVAADHLDVRSGVQTTDEIGDLAVQFDQMVERLAASQKQLENAHQVMIRTERLSVLGNVASGVAHEIGNPLHAAHQFVEGLRATPEAAPRYLPLIDEALTRIDAVIRKMLGFSRERRLTPERTEVNEALTRVVEFISYDRRRREADLRLDLAEDLPAVVIDSDSLGQAVINLLVNALDAIGGKGSVWVSTRQQNERHKSYVVVQVRDDGPGIPPDKVERIFDPFFTTKEAGLGTGLGLSVSQELVTVQGGHIQLVMNEGPGATFEIWLPVAEGT